MTSSKAPKPRVYKANSIEGRGTWVCEVEDGWLTHSVQAPDWSTALMYAWQWVAAHERTVMLSRNDCELLATALLYYD